ncbi:MAG: glucan biosynthesis protein, partial [Alphaproteobacteria bacterium]
EGEEFPEFRDFWLERPPQGATKLTVHALLDSPSATGAYKFTISPGKTTEMEVRATLFIRKKIARLGIAPLTSMYFVGGTTAVRPDDFRPQVHDSQGLSVWTGKGEWIWRPLGNPRRLRLSLFADESPRGFGLLQRDRDFRNYQDLEAHYERRPSLWVEPIDALGKGWIQLVEIPTDAEIHDNIVAFWTPEQAVEAGQRMRLAYRLHWCDESPHRPNIAETTSSRTGRASFGGKKIDGAARKFVVDFKGGKLGSLPADAKPQPMISVTNAKVIYSVAQKLTGTDGWRLTFDLAADGTKPVELRCALVLNDETLSETWSYQWSP